MVLSAVMLRDQPAPSQNPGAPDNPSPRCGDPVHLGSHGGGAPAPQPFTSRAPPRDSPLWFFGLDSITRGTSARSTKTANGNSDLLESIRGSRLATFLFGPVLVRARVQSRLHRDFTCCCQHSVLVLHSRNCTATSQLAEARSCLGAGHLLSTLPLFGRDCPPCSALGSMVEIAYRCCVRSSDRTRTEYSDNS